MRTDDLDYTLPPHLIAQRPADRRDAARLMVARPQSVDHHHVHHLPDLLMPGDLLVVNDTRVLPARFHATRTTTGGHVEGLFIETRDDTHWHVMLKSGGKLVPGETLTFDTDHTLLLDEKQPDGSWFVTKQGDLDTETLLDRVGRMPLPPYIQQQRDADTDWDTLDRQRYQTVYADRAGAVAAPTAGLHFTDELLAQIRQRGIDIASLTLHVGLGTFQPVRSDTIEDHPMHSERFVVPTQTLDAIRLARAEGRRIVAVGTTSVRALESLPDPLPTADYTAQTDLMIAPGFAFRYTDALMTNFHLPRSTLLALVAAMTGLERLMALYQTAVAHEYRFYSYGDAMLILNDR